MVNLQGINESTKSIIHYYEDSGQTQMARLIHKMADDQSRLTLHLLISHKTLCLLRQPDPLTLWWVRVEQAEGESFLVAYDTGDEHEPLVQHRADTVESAFRLVQDAIEKCGAWSKRSRGESAREVPQTEKMAWIEALNKVQRDPSTTPLCPRCREGWLNITDVPLARGRGKERWLICSLCPGRAACLMPNG